MDSEDTSELTTIQRQTREWLDSRAFSVMGQIDDKDIMARLRGLSVLQLRYIATRQDVKYDKDAADIIGISPQVVSRWERKRDIDDIVQHISVSKVMLARAILAQKCADAAIVVADLLDGEIIDGLGGSRLKAAREILNRSGIIAPTRSESVRLSKHIIETRNPREYSEDQLHAIIDGEVIRTIDDDV